MSNHDAVAALPISSAASQTLVRNVLVKRMPYALADADNPQTLVETDPTTGAVILDILYLGRVFHYDAADTTTAHDGVTCLVTSGGKRYKLAAGSDVVAYAVLSREDSDPASPAIGDAHLVNVAATGAYAGEDNNVAVYTARGWEFIDFGIGRLIYVEDEDAYYRRKVDGSWSAGFGNRSFEAGTVPPSAMIGGGGRVLWEIENQTTNTPPAVTNGVAYIIGPVPTDEWAGNAGKIAHGENSVWVIYAPAAGWRAYDKAITQDYQYSGTAWASATGRLNITLRSYTASATWSKPARLAYIRVTVIGGGGNEKSGADGNGTSGSTSSFGAHCSATGGTGGNISGGTANAAAGGTATGGDINISGNVSNIGQGTSAETIAITGARGVGPFPSKGQGGASSRSAGSAASSGASGACSIKVIDQSVLASTETVTVGSAAQNNGFVYVEEFTYA